MTVFFSNSRNERRKQLLALVFFLVLLPFTTPRAQADPTERIQRLMEEVRLSSFPELQGVPIQIQLFGSESDYFQARFTITSFLRQRTLRYVLCVNRQLFAVPPPEAALRAVLAHELGHLLYYQSHCRLQLVLLARLGLPGLAAGFERAARRTVFRAGAVARKNRSC